MDRETLSKYITVKEYAARLGVSCRAVYLWINSGKLRAYRLSPNKTFIDPNDLPEGAGFTS